MYKGYEFAKKIAIGLVVVTVITAVMGVGMAVKDGMDFYNIIIKRRDEKMKYWLNKRYNIKNPFWLNVFFISKPIVFLAAFVLYIQISNHYIIAQKQMKKLINDSCVDLSVKYILGYSNDLSKS